MKSEERQDNAGQAKTMQMLGKTQDMTRQCRAGHGKAGCDKTMQGGARLGGIGQGSER